MSRLRVYDNPYRQHKKILHAPGFYILRVYNVLRRKKEWKISEINKIVGRGGYLKDALHCLKSLGLIKEYKDKTLTKVYSLK